MTVHYSRPSMLPTSPPESRGDVYSDHDNCVFCNIGLRGRDQNETLEDGNVFESEYHPGHCIECAALLDTRRLTICPAKDCGETFRAGTFKHCEECRMYSSVALTTERLEDSGRCIHVVTATYQHRDDCGPFITRFEDVNRAEAWARALYAQDYV